jgi:hypothetical protein
MGAAWYWARADLRRRRQAALGLALLVALAVIVPVTAAAAARRTATAADRMHEELRPYHLNLQFVDGAPPADTLERLLAMSEVENAAEGAAVLARPVGTDFAFHEGWGHGALSPALGHEFDRARMREGRFPTGADEVMISPRVADQLGVGVGDVIELETISPDSVQEAFMGGGVPAYDGPRVRLEVVGVGQRDEELTSGGEAPVPLFALAPPFFDRWGEEVGHFDGVFVVRLRGGTGNAAAFEAAAAVVFADRPDVTIRGTEELARIDDAVRSQASGLLVLAGAAALAGIVAAGQAIHRHVLASGPDHRTLAALGFDRRAGSAAAGLVAIMPTGAGVAAALAGAVYASRWFPTGTAGRIEPDKGAQADLVVAGATVASMSLLALAAAVTALRPPSARVGRGRALPGELARAARSPVVSTGLRAATDPGRGRRAVPVRSAVLASALGIAGVLGAVVFSASLQRLIDTPQRYGWPFDYQVGVGDLLTDDQVRTEIATLVGDDRFTDVTLVRTHEVQLEGRNTPAYALQALKGEPQVTLVAGRVPTADHEVALGATNLQRTGAGMGDRIEATGAAGEIVRLTVVGQVLVPTEETDDPANAAVMTPATLRRLRTTGAAYPNVYLTLAPGVDHATAVADLEAYGFVAGAIPPPVVTNLQGVDGFPLALGGFLAALGVAATAHTLLTLLRRRGAELAVLKTLGFSRRQVAGTVVVQASVFAAAGLAVGVPGGLIVGRQAWRALAGAVGVAGDIVVPVAALAAAVPITFGLVLLIAALPARAAARVRPAVALRSE